MKKYDLSKITKKLNLSSKFNKIDVVKNRRKLILIRNIFNKNKKAIIESIIKDVGKSKKDAEQNAAIECLKNIN